MQGKRAEQKTKKAQKQFETKVDLTPIKDFQNFNSADVPQ